MKRTYGYVPSGKRPGLAKNFVADQFDSELDACIKHVESLLKPDKREPKNRWLPPRASLATWKSG